MTRGRVCRVLPDVPAVDRAFDYLVPDDFDAAVRVGTVVRVPLHGRRVRGWVVGTDVTPEAPLDRLLPLRAVVSAGPPAALVDLCTWAAWRWAGPAAALLRAASPARIVPPDPPPEIDAAVYPRREPPIPLAESTTRVVSWPPARPRLDLVRALVGAEGSTILVVPDRVEAAQVATALEADGRVVLRWESDQPAAARALAWSRARSGACVVVGGRIGAFAPVPDLRVAIVLDDADEALKEERTPAWHARDVLTERAARVGAHVDIVTPAPTVEAAELGPVTGLPRGDERAGWPRLEIIDPRDDPPGTGLLSRPFAAALHRTLASGSRVVCVLNRKGRARLLACRSCDELARCARCGAAVGEQSGAFRCVRCGASRALECLHDGGIAFRVVRPAIGRAREELAALAPRARVVAVDASSAPLPAFDVAVGTEAALHRVRADGGRTVELVAFLEFDQELLAPRYRAAEQALWLLVRAARIVGARGGPGTVLVQSRVPGDPVLAAAAGGDPALVVGAERARRAALRFPPFGGLAEVAGDATAVGTACDLLRDRLDVLGPTGGRALLRASSSGALADVLRAVDLAPARALGRLRIDVDPLRV